MKINKGDINFKKINRMIDELDGVDCISILMLCAILIKSVAEQDNSSIDTQIENTKKLIEAISEIKE